MSAWFYILIFILSQIAGAAIPFVATLFGLPFLAATEYALFIANAVAIALCLWAKPEHGSWTDFISAFRPNKRRLTLLIVLVAPPIIFLVNWVQELLPPLPDIIPDQSLEALFNSPLGLITVCMLGPLAEELIFRAGILGNLLHKQRPFMAITLSAIIFAIIHLNPAQLPAAFCIGLLLGWAYYRTQSIAASLLIHVINNSIAVAFPDSSLTDFLPTTLYQIIAVVFALIWAAAVIHLSR